jgi:hypothetical protein
MTFPMGYITPVDLIVSAFSQQEGWFDTDRTVIPITHNNPLDLDYENQLNATGKIGDIATFSSPATGIVAAYRQVWLWVAMGYTVAKMVETQAPASAGNDTDKYLSNVLAWTKLPGNVEVLKLLPPLVKIG